MPGAFTTYYLEMLSPSDLRAKRSPRRDLDFMRVPGPSPELNRFFYETCGAQWHWVDRLPWSRERWMHWLDRPEVETWILKVSGEQAGYCELEARAGGDVEIVFFGLLPPFIGMGFGAHALTCAVGRAWAMCGGKTKRVWVHTDSRDHPHALRNYEARGFRLYDTVTKIQ